MSKPKKHILICTNQRPEGHPKGSCNARGSMAIWQKFADVINEKQAFNDVLISGVRSCLGPCGFGPVVVIYPDNVWYGHVADVDVEEIYEKHLVGGEPVKRLEIPEDAFF